MLNRGLGNQHSYYLGHIRKLFCFLSTMMSSPQSSNLEKRSILKVQIDQDFQSFSFLLRLTEWHLFWLSLKQGYSRCGYGFGGCDGLGRLGGFGGLRRLGRFDGFSEFCGFYGLGRFNGFHGFSGFNWFDG